MRVTALLLATALAVSSTAVFAQSSYNIVVEPTGQTIQSIINAPIEYDENGVVKAQHFNADSLTAEEYQAVLDEAARVRAYRQSSGVDYESQYVYTNSASTTTADLATSDKEAAPLYQMELFEPQATTSANTRLHTVSKGETLYSISKLYGVSIPIIQQENGMNTTILSIGQQIRIPGTVVENINTVSQPVYANTSVQEEYGTRRRVVEPTPFYRAPRIEAVGATETVYAILPKDTLSSISRRSCLTVADIVSRNEISNPNDLRPGQKITLPVGHCLAR